MAPSTGHQPERRGHQLGLLQPPPAQLRHQGAGLHRGVRRLLERVRRAGVLERRPRLCPRRAARHGHLEGTHARRGGGRLRRRTRRTIRTRGAPMITDAALALHDVGMCVLPAATDGTKMPGVRSWKQYQSARPGREQVRTWASRAMGIGVLCGQVSGNLAMLEAEGRAVHLLPEVTRLMADHDLAEVWSRIVMGYAEPSPAGGFHWYIRISDGPALPNRKLARVPNPTPEEPRRVDVLFETRGEGGWVVTAPSNGTTHPSGGAWRIATGGPGTIPTITVDERDAVYAVLSMFDRMPVDDGPARPATSSTPADGKRPGDDYNLKADWAEILEGWTRVRRMGAGYAWRRPGKTIGISATTGQADDADRLYVFTTSTGLPSEKPLSKFAAYAHLQHGGDYAAAARELRRAGYGDPIASDGPSLDDLLEPRNSTPAPGTGQQPTTATTLIQAVPTSARTED